MTRVCIVGAGAIGSVIGGRLAHAGHAKVSALARGETLTSLRKHGWRLKLDGEIVSSPVTACSTAVELGPQDVVFIAVKGPALASAASSIAPLLTEDSVVVPAMNGIPWWFCERISGFQGERLRSVDPDGSIASAIPTDHVLGCVVHGSARQIEAGLVQEAMWQQVIIGEPFGDASSRVENLVKLLAEAGCAAVSSSDVRSEIWYKLWGNMTMNPVSAVTGATVDQILADPLVREFCSAAMREAAAVGALLGCPIEQAPEDRHEITAKLGAFKTSMLQDVEAGRQLELDAIVTAVHEIAGRLGMATPNIDALLGMTRLFGRTRDLYPR
jgi:2-dehydropantoate 2-reductase